MEAQRIISYNSKMYRWLVKKRYAEDKDNTEERLHFHLNCSTRERLTNVEWCKAYRRRCKKWKRKEGQNLPIM